MQEQFAIDGIQIVEPDTYQPVISTTSTDDSDRDQQLEMHNTPIGSIAGYDMTWGMLTWDEIAVILNALLNKAQFSFHHPDPTIPHRWVDRDFYVSDYQMAALTLEDGVEKWDGLVIQARRIKPI